MFVNMRQTHRVRFGNSGSNSCRASDGEHLTGEVDAHDSTVRGMGGDGNRTRGCADAHIQDAFLLVVECVPQARARIASPAEEEDQVEEVIEPRQQAIRHSALRGAHVAGLVSAERVADEMRTYPCVQAKVIQQLSAQRPSGAVRVATIPLQDRLQAR
jgi:hypothetical protein